MLAASPGPACRSKLEATDKSPPCRCLRSEDLDHARRVHEALIPSSFRHPLVDVAVLFRPREWLGGDYCQAVLIDDRVLYLTLCDVTGHGIASAMLASRVSMVVRGVLELGPSPREIIERVDAFYQRFYAKAVEDLPLSFLAGRLDLETRAFTYASAGHPGPLHLPRATSTCRQLPAQNVLIGVVDSCILEPGEHSIEVGPGDRLALFSDGVIDGMRADSTPLRYKRLASFLRSTDRDVFALGKSLADELDTAPSELPVDDRTLLLIEVR